MTPTPAFPSPCSLSPYHPFLYLALFISSASLLVHPPFSLLSQIPSPFLHHFLHYPFFKIACLFLCSQRKVLNLWSLHLKTFLTFSSPLFSSLDWFPTLQGFTAYVTNDKRVLFVCFNPSRRHIVNDVVFHIMTLIPTPCIHHMTFTHFCPVYSFIKLRSHAPWLSAFITPRAKGLPPELPLWALGFTELYPPDHSLRGCSLCSLLCVDWGTTAVCSCSEQTQQMCSMVSLWV